MNHQIRWPLVVGAGAVAGLGILVLCVALLSAWLGLRNSFWPMRQTTSIIPGRYDSNGERIYFTATSNSGRPITAEMAGMQMMHAGMMTCATCHGSDGRGGRVTMMMGTFEAPDIRWSQLTSGEHDDAHGAAGEEHPPYTEETVKRAITQGVDPAGQPLDWPMPRWQMSGQDLDDLVAYLKTLD
jgi:cytochrome c oxidase subunit 2